MSEAQILLYNFKDENRLRQIRRYLNRQKISLRMVQPSEYLESLGFLFEIPGFAKNSVFNLGQNFQEEMMVLNGFSSQQLDEFLAFFKENSLPPVALKAVLTPADTCQAAGHFHTPAYAYPGNHALGFYEAP